jgi:2-C-methyl-D-erythritol 4-phosphate cytidylyltransferase
MKKNVAVILAAGSGNRSGFEIPKQMVKLAGKPVVVHTIEAFEKSNLIHEIVVVTNKDCIRDIEELVLKSGFRKVTKILQGGKERWESSWAAINAFADNQDNRNINLIFHDAVRPLVDEAIIERVISGLETHSAVDTVIKTVDTIVKTDNTGSVIDSIPDRSFLRSGQTPQAFHFPVIQKAYQLALKAHDFKVTDDCGILLRYSPQEKILLVEGSQYNQKLTYNEDLAILDKLFQFKKNSYDVSEIPDELFKSQKNKVFIVTGGSSGIGAEVVSSLRNKGIKVYSLSKREGVDISNLEQVKSALQKIFQAEGRIDCIANSAGVLLKEPFGTMEYADLLTVINTNYIGAINVAYAAYDYLKESKGSLLFFTSSSYTYGRAFYSAYSSSKAAIVNLTQALAEEWATYNIKVNCLNPERTLTPMRTAAFGSEDENSLLKASDVAIVALKILLGKESGLVVDVKRPV